MNSKAQVALKVVISLYVTVNLFTILFSNVPVSWHDSLHDVISQKLYPAERYQAEMALFRISYYAHVVGLDNRWQMFGRQSRFNWHFILKGLYSDGRTTREWVFPEPRQSERTVLQRELFDFKEGKYHLNIYGSHNGRMGYAFYLARIYPEYQGLPIRTVVFDIEFQNIRRPEEARLMGDSLDPIKSSRTIDIFFVGSGGGSAAAGRP